MAALAWSGENITPKVESDGVEARRRRRAALRRRPPGRRRSRPSAIARSGAALEQRFDVVGGGDLAAAARGGERGVAVAGRDVEHALVPAQVAGLGELLADDLEGGADDGVVAAGPRGLLAGLEGGEIGRCIHRECCLVGSWMGTPFGECRIEARTGRVASCPVRRRHLPDRPHFARAGPRLARASGETWQRVRKASRLASRASRSQWAPLNRDQAPCRTRSPKPFASCAWSAPSSSAPGSPRRGAPVPARRRRRADPRARRRARGDLPHHHRGRVRRRARRTQPPMHLVAGDVVVFPQGDEHRMASEPGLEPAKSAEPARSCCRAARASWSTAAAERSRAWSAATSPAKRALRASCWRDCRRWCASTCAAPTPAPGSRPRCATRSPRCARRARAARACSGQAGRSCSSSRCCAST